MYTIFYLDFWGNHEEDDRLDFVDRGPAEAAFKAIAARFPTGVYGPEIVEIALYDESIGEMLATTATV